MGVNAADIELTHYSGTVIPLQIVTIRDREGVPQPREIRSALSAAVADSPIADWLEPYVQETWIGGCGGGGAKRGYTQAPGVVTRIGDSEQGYAFPGPAASSTNFSLLTTNASDTPIRAIEEFGADLWFAQQGTVVANTPRVVRATNGGASLADSLLVGANNALTDLLVFDNGSGTNYLWAAGVDSNGARLHYWNGATWTSTASNAFTAAAGASVRFDWLQKVFWHTANGDQDDRMVAGNSATGQISYTRPNADPSDPADWVLNAFKVKTTGAIRKPPAIRRHLYIPSTDNVFDFDELGNSVGIVSDMDRHRHPFNGYASFYMDDYIYFSYMTTLARVYVGEAGVLNTTPGVCGPGDFTGAEHEFGGWVTCITGDQGYIVVSTFNPNNGKCGIWWGRDRKHYPEIETANPMVWFGPEIFSEADIFVTAMRTHTRITDNLLHLWVAASPYSAAGTSFVGGDPDISYFTIPTAGQPLSDFLTGGNALFAVGSTPGPWQPYSRILSLPYSWGDKASTKYLHTPTIGSRGLDAAGNGTALEIYTRADPEPGDATFPGGVGVEVSPVETVALGTTTYGSKTQYMIAFFSPHGADVVASRAVAVLDSVSIPAFRRVQTVRVFDITAQYGPRVPDLAGGTDPSKTVDDLRDLLLDLTEGDRTTMRIRPDHRYTVLVRQVMDETDALVGEAEQATVRLQIGVLAQL